MSLADDARLIMSMVDPDQSRLAEMSAKISILQAVVERHDRLIDQQGEVLEKLTNFMSENRPTLREIVEAVAEFYTVAPNDIHSQRRSQSFAHPRLIVYYLARKLTRLSLTSIGRRLGERDHTTIRTGFLRTVQRLRRDEVLRDDLDILRARIAEKVMQRELAVSKGGTLLPPPAVRQ